LVVIKEDALTEGKLDEAAYMLTGDDLTIVLDALSDVPGISLATPRLDLNGLLSNGENSVIFFAIAVEPEVYLDFTSRFTWNGSGEQLSPDEPEGGLLADGLARILGADLGRVLTLFSTTVENRMNAVDVNVRGTFPTGSSATDDKFMILPYALGQRLYRTEGASSVIVVLDDGVSQAEGREIVNQHLEGTGLALEVRNWQELSAFYRGVENIYQMIFGFMFLIVLVVVLMGVFNTMTMAAMERTREIGMLRALGLSPRRVRRVFALEGTLIGLVAGFGALLLSIAAASAINAAGITYQPPGVTGPVQLITDILPGPFIGNALTVAVLSGLISMLPAHLAARRQIVTALRHS